MRILNRFSSLPSFSLASNFSIVGRTTQDTMALYSAMYGRSKRGDLTPTERLRFKAVAYTVKSRLELVEVTAEDKFADLHTQMAGSFTAEDLLEKAQNLVGQCKDRVHSFGMDDVEALKTNRLGGPQGNKTAYALIDPQTRQVLSAIYVYRSTTPVVEGQEPYAHIPGNVHSILHEDIHDINAPVTSNIFFSITGFSKMSGEGEMLISKLHTHLNEQYKAQPDVIFSTLSPFRGFKVWSDGGDMHNGDATNNALACLLDDQADGVKRFHLSNGAEVYAVREGANVEGSKDYEQGGNMMINYGYPRDSKILTLNATTFNAGNVEARLSPSLLGQLNAMSGAPAQEMTCERSFK